MNYPFKVWYNLIQLCWPAQWERRQSLWLQTGWSGRWEAESWRSRRGLDRAPQTAHLTHPAQRPEAFQHTPGPAENGTHWSAEGRPEDKHRLPLHLKLTCILSDQILIGQSKKAFSPEVNAQPETHFATKYQSITNPHVAAKERLAHRSNQDNYAIHTGGRMIITAREKASRDIYC